MKLETIHELDGDFMGNVIGFYCLGHHDAKLFYEEAFEEWKQYVLEHYDEIESEEVPVPFHVNDVKVCYYRYPTEDELDKGWYESDMEFIYYKEFVEGLAPITSVTFD